MVWIRSTQIQQVSFYKYEEYEYENDSEDEDIDKDKDDDNNNENEELILLQRVSQIWDTQKNKHCGCPASVTLDWSLCSDSVAGLGWHTGRFQASPIKMKVTVEMKIKMKMITKTTMIMKMKDWQN